MLKENKEIIYIEIDGPKNAKGMTPFTVYTWVDWTPSKPEPHWNAQCFVSDLDAFRKRAPRPTEVVGA